MNAVSSGMGRKVSLNLRSPAGSFRWRWPRGSACAGKIHQPEGKLPAIMRAVGRVVRGFLELARISGGIFFARIAIIRRETVEHLLVPHPVLEHLRRRFHEIARHARAGETRAPRASGSRASRGRTRGRASPRSVIEQRRFVAGRRREVADERKDRALIISVARAACRQ